MYKPSRALLVSFVLSITGLLAMQGCGKGDLNTPADALRCSNSFALTPIASPLLDSQSPGVLRLEEQQPADSSGDVAIRVSVDSARALKAAYFTLDYDAARYTPIAVEAGPALRGVAAAEQLLELYILDRPGRVYCGQCLAHWDKLAGFSGDGLVATAYFARRALSTSVKTVSTPPDSLLSKTNLTWDPGSNTLLWRYYSQGDYDQNGEVSISDLSPLGLYFGQTCSYPLDDELAKGCADGDHNGELNIADLTPIGNNLGKDMLQGWNIYATSDPAQYPAIPTAGNGTAVLIGSVALADRDPGTVPGRDRLLYYYAVSAPVAGDVYWVRPVDSSDAEGIASNYAPGGSPGNHDPQILGFTASAEPVSLQASVVVVVNATDPDGDPLTYSCTPDADVAFTDGDERPESFLLLMPTVAADTSRTIQFDVTDGRGGHATGSYSVTIVAPVPGNSPPIINGLTAIPNPVASGGTVALFLDVTDPDGDTLSYTWSAVGSPSGYVAPFEAHATFYAPVVSVDTNVEIFDQVDDGHGNSYNGSTTILVTASGANIPPTAVLATVPTSGPAPLSVDFNASTSYDTDGTITAYDWDLDADGIYEVMDGGATQTYIYNSPGTYYPTVRVTDDDGATGTCQDVIQVSPAGPTWHISAITSSHDIGQFSSLAEVVGCPAISYWDATSQYLMYILANDPLGASWGTPVAADSSGQVGIVGGTGNYTSLVVVQNAPAIAYCRDNKLYYTRSDDSTGSTWNSPSPTAIDGGDPSELRVGECASMALVNGNPAIAYYYFINPGLLYFIRANDSIGNTWGVPIYVDGGPPRDVGWSACLAVVGGYPMISYHDDWDTYIYLAASSDVNGTGGSWLTHMPVSESQNAFYGTSLIDLGGLPAIAYSNDYYGKLYYVRATDASLSTWTTPVVVASTRSETHGDFSSMKLYNGAPAISYFSRDNGSLVFSTAADANGDLWNVCQDVDAPSPTERVGAYTCLAIIGGNPAISYSDLYNTDLKFAIYY